MTGKEDRDIAPKPPPAYSADPANGNIRIRPRKKLLDRLPATAERIEAFDLLHERLAVATEFFQHHGDGGRHGVYRAMGDLIEYLTSRGIPHATLRPIEAVMVAIVDADRGAESPIFKPKREPNSGKPPKSVAQLTFEGHLITVTECCVRHCKQEGHWPFVGPGCALAAKLVNESAWPIKVTAKQMRELRERAQQSPRKSPDRILLDNVLSSPFAEVQPLKWAQVLLANELVGPPPKLSV